MSEILLRKLKTLSKQIKSKGFLLAGKIYIDTLAVFILSKIYGFPASWHPPTSARPYRLTVAQAVNSVKPQIVCEVGCGLGSILSRVNSPIRYGFDIDAGVVRAAKVLRTRNLHLEVGSLESVDLEHIDVLVLVNWIHEINPAELEERLSPLLRKTRYLLLDAIDVDNDYGYQYKHDFAFLSGKASLVSVSRCPGEGRSFRLFYVNS
jgi:hypothetical protein